MLGSQDRDQQKTFTTTLNQTQPLKTRSHYESANAGQNEAKWAPSRGGPPDALLMSRVSRSISPPVAIKEAPWSSQQAAGLFITSHRSHGRPSSSETAPHTYLRLARWRGTLRASWLRTGPRGRSLGSTGWRSRSPTQRSCQREKWR